MARRASPVAGGVAADLVLEIEALGRRGEGVAQSDGREIFIPLALPGERVRVRPTGPGRATAVEWLRRAPERREPPCRHFAACGGCAVQHLDDAAYAAWKVGLLARALAARGLGEAPILPLVRTPPASRRRADFTASRSGERVSLGFHASDGPAIVDLAVCAVLEPAIVALLPALRLALREILGDGEAADAQVALSEGEIELVVAAGRPPSAADIAALARLAEARDLVRVAWRRDDGAPEIAVGRRPFRARFGDIAVDLPPAAFLQASREGERAIVAALRRSLSGARRIADLYAGAGALGLPLARAARVHAVEGDAAAVAALDKAVRAAGLAGRVTVERRDLRRRPLSPEELAGFDAVVFDPPRDGAPEQARMLARSRTARVVAVTCNPASFARDARILVDGGYRTVAVEPIDQFLWSPHLEAVAEFRR